MWVRTALLLLALRSEIKWRHWQTTSYAVHRALDDLDRELAEPVDLWVEAMQGKHGRASLRAPHVSELRADLGDARRPGGFGASATATWLKRRRLLLEEARAWGEERGESDLAALLDDIIAVLSRAAYRLTLL